MYVKRGKVFFLRVFVKIWKIKIRKKFNILIEGIFMYF